MPISSEWRVLPHGAIVEVTENLWTVEGTLPKGALKRVMSIAKLSDGRLVVHSAVAVDEDSVAKIEAWGMPAFLLVPNRMHRTDALAYKTRFPQLHILAPAAARSAVDEVVTTEGDYSQFPKDDAVSLISLAGTGHREGVMKVISSDGTTLVFSDVIFNMPHVGGAIGWILRHITNSTGGPRISRLARMGLVRDTKTLRAELEQLAATPHLTRIIVSHHLPIEVHAANVLLGIAASL